MYPFLAIKVEQGKPGLNGKSEPIRHSQHDTMAYHADLRSSYCSVRFNISWFYEFLSEQEVNIEFNPTYGGGRTEEQGIAHTRRCFEDYINEAFHDWTVYKVFGHTKGDEKEYELCEDVWEFLRERMDRYMEKNPNVVFEQDEDDEDNEDDE